MRVAALPRSRERSEGSLSISDSARVESDAENLDFASYISHCVSPESQHRARGERLCAGISQGDWMRRTPSAKLDQTSFLSQSKLPFFFVVRTSPSIADLVAAGNGRSDVLNFLRGLPS